MTLDVLAVKERSVTKDFIAEILLKATYDDLMAHYTEKGLGLAQSVRHFASSASNQLSNETHHLRALAVLGMSLGYNQDKMFKPYYPQSRKTAVEESILKKGIGSAIIGVSSFHNFIKELEKYLVPNVVNDRWI